jgi:hypothetical protein
MPIGDIEASVSVSWFELEREARASLLIKKRDPQQRAAGQKIYIIKKGVEFYYRPATLM